MISIHNLVLNLNLKIIIIKGNIKMESNNIYFVAVGRVRDQKIISQYLTNQNFLNKQKEFGEYCVNLLKK